jgi:hypothetical protein
MSNLHNAHRRPLIHGAPWGQEDHAHVAQLYGGYIIPGSTLDDMHLTISQWNTDTGWPYRVIQHRIRRVHAIAPNPTDVGRAMDRLVWTDRLHRPLNRH